MENRFANLPCANVNIGLFVRPGEYSVNYDGAEFEVSRSVFIQCGNASIRFYGSNDDLRLFAERIAETARLLALQPTPDHAATIASIHSASARGKQPQS